MNSEASWIGRGIIKTLGHNREAESGFVVEVDLWIFRGVTIVLCCGWTGRASCCDAGQSFVGVHCVLPLLLCLFESVHPESILKGFC